MKVKQWTEMDSLILLVNLLIGEVEELDLRYNGLKFTNNKRFVNLKEYVEKQ